jgi:hypothetical protein
MSNSIRSSEVSNKTLKKGPRNGGLPQGSNSFFEEVVIVPKPEATPAAVVEIPVFSSPVEVVEPIVEVQPETASDISLPEIVEVPAPAATIPEKTTTTSSSTGSTSNFPKKKR